MKSEEDSCVVEKKHLKGDISEMQEQWNLDHNDVGRHEILLK